MGSNSIFFGQKTKNSFMSTLPKNYQQVMPYLIIKDAAKFIEFTQQVFDAKETYRAMRDENCIQHAEIMIGDSTIMLADSTEKYQPRPAGMFIYVEDADKTYLKALSAGAISVMEPADQPYGRSGGIMDVYGNNWWLTTSPSK
jgi:PhnB protein